MNQFDALFSWLRGLAKGRRDLPDTREVCSGHLVGIWDAGLQVHERSHDYVPMTIDMTKLRDSATSSQGVDSTLYRQLIGSLMYLRDQISVTQ